MSKNNISHLATSWSPINQKFSPLPKFLQIKHKSHNQSGENSNSMETIFPPSAKLKLPHSKIQSLYFSPVFPIHSTKKSSLLNKPINFSWHINPHNTEKCPRLLLALNTSSSSGYNENGSELITQNGIENLPLSVELQPILDESQFDKVLNEAQQAQESVVILWMANWCRKCIYLKPKLAKLAADYYPRVKFYSVDVNTVPHKLVVRAGVTKMPTIQLWRDGQKKAEVIGGHKAYLVVNEIREIIENEDDL